MRIRSVWVLPTALITGLTLAIPISSLAAHAAAPALAKGLATAKTVTTSPISATLTLPTGDRIQLRGPANGKQTIATRPAATSGPGQALISRTQGGDRYVTPADAQPYLGRFLDPGLFDVTRLAEAQKANHHLPVVISYTGRAPKAPGITITSASAGIAKGYLTPTSSLAFGRALSAQWKADSAAGWPRHSTLFTGVQKISADVPAAPGTVHPDYPQYTLILKVTGPDGKPEADGSVELTNMDSAQKADESVEVVDGEARFSVPKGHYSAIALDVSTDKAGADHFRITTVTDYSFTKSGQTMTIDHRKATIAPKVSVPKKAGLTGYDFVEQRTALDGGILSFDFETPTPADFRYAPAAAAKVGRLDLFQKWSLAGGSGSGAYTYDLAAATVGIPSRSTYTFAAKDLATIKAAYYSDGTTHTSDFFRSADYPFEDTDAAVYVPVKLGTRRTEYVGATGKPDWFDELVADPDNLDDPGYLDAPSRPIVAGSALTANWLRGPIGAGIPKERGDSEASGEEGETQCFACRSAKTMNLNYRGVTDSDAYHFGDETGSFDTGAPVDGIAVNRFRVYANGKKIDDEGDLAEGVFAVPTGKTTYKELIDVDRRLARPEQSTISQTQVTFSSAQKTGPEMPPDWNCSEAATCRVLPIVQAKLSLPTDLHGRLPVGKSTVTVTVARIQHAAASAAKSATLEIRPAGEDWIPVKLTSIGAGKFRGTVDNTADLAGLDVDVRFTGADKAGSTFKQTVVRAYTVAGS